MLYDTMVTGHPRRLLPGVKGLLSLAALSIFVWYSAQAMGDASRVSPRDLVIETSERMLKALKDEHDLIAEQPERVYQLVSNIVIEHFDFGLMSKWVLGKYWQRITPDQQSRFTLEFRTLLVRTYAISLTEYSNQQITYLPLQAQDNADDVVVRTELQTTTGQTVAINYSMQLRGGYWKVYDVSIDGVSLVMNYRTTFSNEIRQGGIDALIESLAARNRQSGS